MKYALNGIIEAFKTQWNMKIHGVAALLVLGAGIFFEISLPEWMILILCIGIVMIAEVANTAIEYFVDFVSPELHPVAGKIKDLSAGAVLIAAVTAAVTGFLIFGPKLLVMFS